MKTLSRRGFLRLSVTASTLTAVALSGCDGYFPAEDGAPYAPWDFPPNEPRPEWVAVSAALLASSPHNTQPWHFVITPQAIDLFADLTKSLRSMDPMHREMHIGLGCAVENLVIAAREHGRASVVTLMPDPEDATHMAHIKLTPVEGPSPWRDLYAAISKRRTHRGLYADAPAPGLDAALLKLIRPEETVAMTWLAGASVKTLFHQETVNATQAIADDPDMGADSHRWYRHSQKALREHRDGITLDATGTGATNRFFGKIVDHPDVDTTNAYWLDGTREVHGSASAFVILSTAHLTDPAEALEVGRVYQRMQLWATTQGVGFHPLNQMAEQRDRELELGRTPKFGTILEGLSEGGHAQMLFRVGFPWDKAFKSPRRPIAWVAEAGK